MRRNSSLEVVILENLIGRLYNLLSDEMKHTLIVDLEKKKDDFENLSWLPVARFLPSKTKSFLQNRSASVLNEISSTFAELQRQPTVKNWNRIVSFARTNELMNEKISKYFFDRFHCTRNLTIVFHV